jgi:YtkA-like
VKVALLLFGLCGIGVVSQQRAIAWAQSAREGNFEIRFEPTAKLQTGVDIPFEIHVQDALHKPVVGATLQVEYEMADHSHAATVKAPAVNPIANPGVYLAKPVFPVPGDWDVQVIVRRGDEQSARTIRYNVPE